MAYQVGSSGSYWTALSDWPKIPYCSSACQRCDGCGYCFEQPVYPVLKWSLLVRTWIWRASISFMVSRPISKPAIGVASSWDNRWSYLHRYDEAAEKAHLERGVSGATLLEAQQVMLGVSCEARCGLQVSEVSSSCSASIHVRFRFAARLSGAGLVTWSWWAPWY